MAVIWVIGGHSTVMFVQGHIKAILILHKRAAYVFDYIGLMDIDLPYIFMRGDDLRNCVYTCEKKQTIKI